MKRLKNKRALNARGVGERNERTKREKEGKEGKREREKEEKKKAQVRAGVCRDSMRNGSVNDARTGWPGPG